MYCIECGSQIPQNAKFCPHCGYNQVNSGISSKKRISEVIIEIIRPIFRTRDSEIDYNFLRKAIGWYLAWLLVHLFLLLIFAEKFFDDYNDEDNRYFWPFSKNSEINDYDIREFIIYTIFPLAIFIIRKLVTIKSKDENGTEKNEDDDTY